MKLKNFTSKIFTALTLLLIGFAVNAQSQQDVTLGDATVYNYTVDTSSDLTQPLLNDQLDGTTGSTYTWTIVDAAAPDAIIIPNGNKATINWGAVPVGIYHVQVIESNANCPDVMVEFEVHVIQPDNPELDWTDTTPICEGDDATFTITNAPAGAIISYTATGGTPATGTATVLGDGTAIIAITHVAPATEIVLTLTSMNVGGNVVTFPTDPAITATAQVNIVQTSPILLTP